MKRCEVLRPMFMDMELIECGKRAVGQFREIDGGAKAWMCGAHAREFRGDVVRIHAIAKRAGGK